jgi:hypothetical protein
MLATRRYITTRLTGVIDGLREVSTANAGRIDELLRNLAGRARKHSTRGFINDHDRLTGVVGRCGVPHTRNRRSRLRVTAVRLKRIAPLLIDRAIDWSGQASRQRHSTGARRGDQGDSCRRVATMPSSSGRRCNCSRRGRPQGLHNSRGWRRWNRQGRCDGYRSRGA